MEYHAGALNHAEGISKKYLTRNEIIEQIKTLVTGRPKDFCIGKSNDAQAIRTRQTVASEWRLYKMNSSQSAMIVENAFLSYGCNGIPNSEDDNSLYLFIFRVTPRDKHDRSSI